MGLEDASAAGTLLPLTPSSIPDQHDLYVNELAAAVRNSRIRNIALTGRYGSGKSSVLEAFAALPENQGRTLILALSTLGADPSTPAGEEGEETVTNRIEKELVKQLLHRERPTKLPQSRYRRIRSLSLRTALWQSLALCAAFAAMAWTIGWTPEFPQFAGDGDLTAWVGVAVSAVLVVWLVAWGRVSLRGRFRLSGLSAAGTSVSLADTSNSYFDKYLDEIVYFFEAVTSIEVVIFEDLDRFDDPGIFEALRELNTLINNSKQTEGRTIRFVYALRDSIFEQLGHEAGASNGDAASAEAVRANRTKFFDLVIPIVPFITHRNARDHLVRLLAHQQFAQSSKPSMAVVDLVARHLPDMRLLTNVVNEYAIFSRRLIDEAAGVTGLKADNLFAIVVFKNIHLADFERIQLGQSSLDEIYAASRELIATSIAAERAKLSRLQRAESYVDRMKARLGSFARTLDWYLDKHRNQNYGIASLVVDDNTFEPTQSSDPDFWKALLESAGGLTAQQTGNRGTFSVSQADLQNLFGARLNFDEWDRMTRQQLTHDRESVERDLELLRHADFSWLMDRSEFELTYLGEPLAFSGVVDRVAGSEIQVALIRAGYIDANFALYVSQYYGDRVPPNSMNFMLQHVERNRPDSEYPFADDEEIEAVIRESPEGFLASRVAYNTEIVDYLTRDREAGASHPVLDQVIKMSADNEVEFVRTYLAAGSFRHDSVAYLASAWRPTFTEVAQLESVDEKVRTALFDVALANSSDEVPYETSGDVVEFLESMATSMPSLSSLEESEESALWSDCGKEQAARTAARLGWQCKSLVTLNAPARRSIIERGAFEITAENVQAMVGNGSLSLDSIKQAAPEGFKSVVSRLAQYVEAVTKDLPSDSSGTRSGRHLTIEDPDNFAEILLDLRRSDPSDVEIVLRHADSRCKVRDLRAVPESLWNPVVAAGRLVPTASSIAAYIGPSDTVNADLARVLASHDFEIEDDLADEMPTLGADGEAEPQESTKRRIATAILKSVDSIPSAEDRTTAVASLGLEEPLPTALVPQESGSLLAWLLQRDLVAVSDEALKHFAPMDWDTLHSAWLASPSIARSLAVDHLEEGCLANPFSSHGEEDCPLIREVLQRFEEFLPSSGSEAALLEAAARAAIACGIEMTVEALTAVAAGTHDGALVVDLLASHDSSIDGHTVRAILSLVDKAPYNRLPALEPGKHLDFSRRTAVDVVIRKLHGIDDLGVRRVKASFTKPERLRVFRKSTSL